MNRRSAWCVARLVPWAGFAGIMAVFPGRAQSQTTPKTTLHCYVCQQVDDVPDIICVGSEAPGAQLACSQYYTGDGWRCFLYGGDCPNVSLEAVPLADFANSEGVGAWVEAASVDEGAHPNVWEFHGCSGALVAVYVQTPGDRFVRAGS